MYQSHGRKICLCLRLFPPSPQRLVLQLTFIFQIRLDQVEDLTVGATWEGSKKLQQDTTLPDSASRCSWILRVEDVMHQALSSILVGFIVPTMDWTALDFSCDKGYHNNCAMAGKYMCQKKED